MLLPRFITALVGAPLLIASIWWGQIPFFLLVSGMILLALHEYYTLAQDARWPVSKRTGLACGVALIFAVALFGTKFDWNVAAARETLLSAKEMYFIPGLITALLFSILLASALGGGRETAFVDASVTCFGLFYVAWTLSHLFLIRDLRPGGAVYTFFLFLVIWVLDVGAYLGGMKYGKRKMAENVSPKKTWEGALIGSGTAIVVALVCQWTFFKVVTVSQALFLAAVIVVLAQLGDLSESLFKRNVQVKDSGRLLPGHGGILDRFDSFLLAAPAYYYAIVLFVGK